MRDVQDLELTDLVRVDFPSFKYKATGQKLPSLYGSSRYGTAKYGFEQGKEIARTAAWIVYEKTQNPEKMTAVLKLRRYGRVGGDEFLPIHRYGEGVYGGIQYQKEPEA